MKILLILALAITATAQKNWEHLADSDSQKVFVDISTMAGDAKGKEMWVKWLPVSRARYVAQKKLPRNYDHQLSLLRFHCGQNTFIIKESLWYSTDSKVIKSIASSKVRPIVPDSLNAELYGLMCR